MGDSDNFGSGLESGSFGSHLGAGDEEAGECDRPLDWPLPALAPPTATAVCAVGRNQTKAPASIIFNIENGRKMATILGYIPRSGSLTGGQTTLQAAPPWPTLYPQPSFQSTAPL